MKKWICALLGMLMLMGMAAAENDLVGDWVLSEIEYEQQRYAPAQMGADMLLMLYEDGSCEVESGGRTEAGIWNLPGEDTVKISLNIGGTLILSVEEGYLYAEKDGVLMIYTPAVTGLDSPILTQVELTDFNGTWESTAMLYLGVMYDARELSSHMSYDIRDGRIYMSDETQNGVVDFGTLSGNMLSCPGDLNLYLHEDDTLACDVPGYGTMYFRRSEMEHLLRTGVTLEDFAGSWSAVRVETDGMWLTTEMLGMEMTVDISGNTADLYMDTDGKISSGSCGICMDDAYMIMTDSAGDISRWWINVDGTLSYEMSDEGDLVVVLEMVE